MNIYQCLYIKKYFLKKKLFPNDQVMNSFKVYSPFIFYPLNIHTKVYSHRNVYIVNIFTTKTRNESKLRTSLNQMNFPNFYGPKNQSYDHKPTLFPNSNINYDIEKNIINM